jgi:hypothetical protein
MFEQSLIIGESIQPGIPIRDGAGEVAQGQ